MVLLLSWRLVSFTYVVALVVLPLVPLLTEIGRILEPELFDILDAQAVAEPALRGHSGDHELVGEIDLQPLTARHGHVELGLRAPSAARDVLVQSGKRKDWIIFV